MTIEIPPQLHEQKFLLVRPRDKIPLEKDWQNTANYSHNDNKLTSHLDSGGNYGVLCGNGLIVIDADEVPLQEHVEATFPSTFTINTGKGKHYYFFCDGFPKKTVLKDSNGNHLGEIQSTGSQVIGPGCTHPSGRKYQIEKPQHITQLTKARIDRELKKFYSSANEGWDLLDNQSKKDRKEALLNGPKLGNRNDQLFRMACSFRKDGMSAQEAKEMILLANSKAAQPLPAAEINSIIRSTNRYFKDPETPSMELKITNYQDNTLLFWEHHPFFYDENRMYWEWDKEKYCWKITDDINLMISLDKRLEFNGKTIQASFKNGYLEAIRRVGRAKKPKEAKKKYVQFKDQVVDIQTMQAHKVDKRFLFTNPIPWKLGESTETPQIDKLFTDWVGEHKEILYQIIAYCVYRDYPLQYIFCLIGGGRNGKSAYQQILTKFLGVHNTCAVELEDLTGRNKNRFAAFSLYKKLACQMGETNFDQMNNTSMLKKLTGKDMIQFEKKRADPFEDTNYAKVIMATNSLPITEDNSEGFYRRWIIIDFPNQFPEGRDIVETIPDWEYENLARKIPQTLKDLLSMGRFHNQGSIMEREKRYIDASNPLHTFLKKFTTTDKEAYENYSAVYTAYTLYLRNKKRRIVSRQEFSRRIAEAGYEIRRTTKTKTDAFGNVIDRENGTFVEGLSLLCDISEFEKGLMHE